ncbi:Fur family transcriptional regulator [Shinella zoogloeoides]|uniref:Fur family transcriptional regulator n=1 Tax=Shinella zoogloeoides TaxID=352475 RepID=UPI0028A9FEEF|nr:Fur family transcriptional regulator [Shinella zoogloeoides]
MVETMTRQSRNGSDNRDAARDLFAERGLRVTQPRVALAELLFGNGPRHVSAESLHEELVRSGAPGSLSSVYRTLNDLSCAGLLRRMPICGSTAWFDTQVEPHHHFYAEDEDRVIDVPGNGVHVGNLPPPPDGYEFVGIDVLLRVRRRGPPPDA